MDSGHGVFENTEEELRFTLKLAGFNMLAGESVGEGRYTMHVENRGSDFTGQLHSAREGGLANLPTSFRMRPSADGLQLTMVFTVFTMQGRRDVAINAVKIRTGTPEEQFPVPKSR
jgi:hypothetical protein